MEQIPHKDEYGIETITLDNNDDFIYACRKHYARFLLPISRREEKLRPGNLALFGKSAIIACNVITQQW
jgi:hypothetical protein